MRGMMLFSRLPLRCVKSQKPRGRRSRSHSQGQGDFKDRYENDHTASTFHICLPKFCSSSMHPLPRQLGDIACTEDKVINCKKIVARNDNDNRSCDWIALSCPNLALERAIGRDGGAAATQCNLFLEVRNRQLRRHLTRRSIRCHASMSLLLRHSEI